MNRTLVLAAVGLLLLLGAWGVLSFLDGTPPAARAAQPAAAPRLDAPRPRATEDPSAEEARAEIQNDARTPSDSSRAAVEGPSSQELELQIVEVVDGLTHERLAGARLRYAVVERGLVLDDHPGWRLDSCDDWLEEHGSEAESDASGRAELHAPAESLLLVAGSAPQRFGRLHCSALGSTPQTLVLKPDLTLEVHVVGPGGTPLPDATVALKRAQGAWGSTEVLARQSDGLGRVIYPHLGQNVDLAGEAWAVVAPSLLGRAERIDLDPRDLPVGPVVMVFPATGSVEVHVSSIPGLPPIADDTEVALLIDDGKPDELLSFWTRPDAMGGRVDEGVARFAFVPLGLDLIAEAVPDGSNMATRARGRGPSAPGETASISVVVGGDHPVLRLRLVDAQGTPRSEREVTARLDQEMSVSEFGLESDETGHVLVDVSRHAGSGEDAVLVLTVAAQDGEPAARARLPLPEGLRPGINDLGDLTLVPERPLAGGRVVTVDGSGLEDIEIQVAAVHTFGQGEGWTQDLQVSARSGPDGSFLVYGDDPGTSLRVWAHGQGQRSRPVDCAAGSLGLMLQLERSGSVAGRVLLDEGLDPTQLRLLLEPAGSVGIKDHALNLRTHLEPDGSFQVGGLTPGPWTLSLRDAAGEQAVARLEGIEVPSGGPALDPRLAEIDLRGRLTLVNLTLKPPGASDQVMGTLVYRPSGSSPGGEDESTIFLHSPNMSLCVAGRGADVSVQVSGFRTVELAGVSGAVTVELERGPAVRLVLPKGVELPKPPRFLKPFLSQKAGDEGLGGHFQQQVFGDRREVVLFAPGPGRLEVRWYMEERSENTLSTMALTVEEPQVIEVLDLAEEQTFEVTPPGFDP